MLERTQNHRPVLNLGLLPALVQPEEVQQGGGGRHSRVGTRAQRALSARYVGALSAQSKAGLDLSLQYAMAELARDCVRQGAGTRFVGAGECC